MFFCTCVKCLQLLTQLIWECVLQWGVLGKTSFPVGKCMWVMRVSDTDWWDISISKVRYQHSTKLWVMKFKFAFTPTAREEFDVEHTYLEISVSQVERKLWQNCAREIHSGQAFVFLCPRRRSCRNTDPWNCRVKIRAIQVFLGQWKSVNHN